MKAVKRSRLMVRRLVRKGSCSAIACTIALLSPLQASASAYALAPPLALAKKPPSKPGITPAQAAERRAPAQAEGRRLRDGDDPLTAARVYDSAAELHGDPVLYLDAGDAYLEAARKDRNTDHAVTAKERAAIASDILYFHLDSAADKDFRLVDAADVPELLRRANDLDAAADEAIDEIEIAGEAPSADTPAPAQKRRGDGRVKIASGIALASVGGALLVVGVAGLAIGAYNQSRANDSTVYGGTYDEVEKKGKRGNVIAGVGLGLGAAFVAAGVVLYVLGRRDRKRAAADDKVVMVLPTASGVAVSGRF